MLGKKGKIFFNDIYESFKNKELIDENLLKELIAKYTDHVIKSTLKQYNTIENIQELSRSKHKDIYKKIKRP